MQAQCTMFDQAGADLTIAWVDNPFVAPLAPGGTAEQRRATVDLSLSRLAPYYNGIARTSAP